MSDAEPQDSDLATLMEVLASPVRLAVLRELRVPRTLGEIRVRADQSRGGLSPERVISRQAVREHLDRLILAGFVRVRPSTRRGHDVEEYLVNHTALYALTESLREVGFAPTHADWTAATAPASGPTAPLGDSGPSLILVRGMDEGRAFPLPADGAVVIGRRYGLDVCLDYDPYISAEHAVIRMEHGRATLAGLPTGRNGTFLNWRALDGDGPTALATGDIIGVGRSLLVVK